MKTGFSNSVRKVAAALGEFTIDDVGLRLQVKTHQAKKDIRAVVFHFQKSGEVVFLRPGLYRYQGKQIPLTLTEKIWRAILIKGQFRRQDLVRLTGASPGLVERYVWFLTNRGFVKRVSSLGAKITVYCLADPERAPIDHPPMPAGNRNR